MPTDAPSENKHALVVGASGLLGTNFVRHLAARGDWTISALSRSKPQIDCAFTYVAADLLDPAQAGKIAGAVADVTHVFYGSRAVGANYRIEKDPNIRMLVHLLDALEQGAPKLRHVQVMHGMKWYGMNVQQTRIPAKETDPPHPDASFYVGQFKHLTERQAGKPWSWSTIHPHQIYGVATGSPSNLMMLLGAFAAILREQGEPLWFPGPPMTYDAVINASDIDLVIKGMVWAATEPRCANQTFNLVNGDQFRWRDVWPRIAATFEMKTGPVRTMRVADYMADKEPVWRALVKKHGLRETPFAAIGDWAFIDATLTSTWHQIASGVKAHQFGFHEVVDSDEMFARLFAEYRRLRILP